MSKIVASFHFRRGMGRPHSTLPQEIFIQRYVIVFFFKKKRNGKWMCAGDVWGGDRAGISKNGARVVMKLPFFFCWRSKRNAKVCDIPLWDASAHPQLAAKDNQVPFSSISQIIPPQLLKRHLSRIQFPAKKQNKLL